MTTKKTRYFQNCLGVFQGGGCKGSAYVGAYKEAAKWGVSFSELVGTSAGSIVAVLIGAGASPDELERIIQELDFKNFLTPAIKLEKYTPPKYSHFVKFIPFSVTKKYHRIFTHLGLYNSEYLKEWVNKKLAGLLPHVTGPVKFKDLIIPTSVVTTDIVTRRVEIFSQDKSPNKDVCEAVQSSCNIPFFFQPINMRYVDGGLLSNLPAFVFSDIVNKLYNRILAFSLESDQVNTPIQTFADFSKALLETALEGNLELQLALQEDIHIVNINTGKISATDFEKITPENIKYLIRQGETAVREFFYTENARIHTRLKDPNISKDLFNTNNFLTETSGNKYSDIYISEIGNKWVYEIFPTLLKWKENGAIIQVIMQMPADDLEHTNFRTRFLNYWGINVTTVEHIPFKGYIFDGNDSESCRAIILNRSSSDSTPYHSKQYSGEEDFSAIELMMEKLNALISKHVHKKIPVEIEPLTNHELFTLLQQVKQYKDSKVQFAVQEVEVSKVIFITKYIRGYKYRQIHSLFELYTRFGIAPFEPTKLKMQDGRYTAITPPVVEKIGDNLYLIEGNTRFAYAYRNGIKTLKCVVLEGVSTPIPSKGEFRVHEILLSDRKMIGDERYEEFDYNKFRKIEQSVRNPRTCLQ